MVVKTDNIKLVDLRVYRKELGVEVDYEMPKALVIYNAADERYHNLFNQNETYPFLKRVPYTNTTVDHVSYGTKLSVENPSLIDDVGICAIECNDKFLEEIRQKNYRDIKEIEDMVLSSELYFKDRVKIVEDRINNGAKKRKLARILHKDWEKNCHYQDNIFVVDYEMRKAKNKTKTKK